MSEATTNNEYMRLMNIKAFADRCVRSIIEKVIGIERDKMGDMTTDTKLKTLKDHLSEKIKNNTDCNDLSRIDDFLNSIHRSSSDQGFISHQQISEYLSQMITDLLQMNFDLDETLEKEIKEIAVLVVAYKIKIDKKLRDRLFQQTQS